MSQIVDILKHLKRFRTITTLQAFSLYGVTCLHKRIAELRDKGHKIGGYMVRVKTRRGHARVKRHYLVPKCATTKSS